MGGAEVAAGVIGVVVAAIFFYDSWAETTGNAEGGVAHTLRYRSLLTVVGGGALTAGLGQLHDGTGRMTIAYVIAFGIAWAAACFVAGAIGYVSLLVVLRNSGERRRHCYWAAFKAFPDVLLKGWRKYSADLDAKADIARQLDEARRERDELQSSLKSAQERASDLETCEKRLAGAESHRDRLIWVLCGASDTIATKFGAKKTSVSDFENFATHFLESVLTKFFETNGDLERLRACLYCRGDATGDFRFLAGVSPTGRRHTRRALPGSGSMCAAAVEQPERVHHYPGCPFVDRQSTRPYKFVAAVALRPLSNGRVLPFDAVLCVDSPDALPSGSFHEKIMMMAAQMLDDAFTVFGITWKQLEESLSLQSPEASATFTEGRTDELRT